MSIGNWFYYKRKYKLVVLPFLTPPAKYHNILAVTYERNWELPGNYYATYYDINSGITITGKPDLIIEREFNDGKAVYDGLYNTTLKKYSPKVFWFIDAHLADKQRMHYCDKFDFVFVAHSPYIETVKKNTRCKNIFWLPLCYPHKEDTITKNVQSATYPVSFVGRIGEGFDKRKQMVDFLKEEYKEDFLATTNYINPKEIIQQSNITTNQSVRDDLNFRVFEAMGFGTPVATNYAEDIDKIEGLKERLFCFHDLHELKEQVDSFLNNTVVKFSTDEVQQWVKEKHTMKNRLSEMLQMVNSCKQLAYK